MKRLGLVLLILTCSAFSQVSRSTHKIMVFGGYDHKVYLGCLSCSEYAQDSVLNEFGPHGSEYSSTSIMNSFSDYGSKFSSFSACNEFAGEPPVIVDEKGGFYGELTLNEARVERTHSKGALRWLTAVCVSH